MAEKPILFNTEMVRAILDGRKTQTRRIIKPVALGMTYEDGSPARKPPVKPGDILWVRETWRPVRFFRPAKAVPDDFKERGFEYRADGIIRSDGKEDKWHPSIHMPRDAARLFLRVTGVRAERLQSITHQDVLREGIEECVGRKHGDDCACAEIRFSELWDSTIKASDLPLYGWDANPWVCVIEFERIDRNDK